MAGQSDEQPIAPNFGEYLGALGQNVQDTKSHIDLLYEEVEQIGHEVAKIAAQNDQVEKQMAFVFERIAEHRKALARHSAYFSSIFTSLGGLCHIQKRVLEILGLEHEAMPEDWATAQFIDD